MQHASHVVIWDQPGEAPTINGTTVYWNEFFTPADSNNKISLPQYVEDNSDDLKHRYLAFVRKVGETRISNQSTIEHLGILPGFSYWWMTLFACKRWSTTSNITQAVRLIALEDILREIRPTTISFATSQNSVKLIIRDWCARAGIEFQSQSRPYSALLNRIQQSIVITGTLRAIPALIREILHRIRAPKQLLPTNTPVDVVLLDFFSRFDMASATTGVYRSGFWGDLVVALKDAKQKTLVLHKFVASDSIPSRSTTRRPLEGLNSTSKEQQHFLLDSRLSAGVLAKALLIYFRLLMVRFRIRTIKHSFSPNGSQLDLWNLFKREWLDSLSGSTAILHSLAIGELDDTIVKIPSCRTVLYLMENQPWEMAFIQLWKQRRSEPLVGVPHSSIRYWDLRYFTDSDVYHSDLGIRPPNPDTVAVNGPAALKSLDMDGIPGTKITEVEALSYSYLGEVQPTVSTGQVTTTSTRLLVLGDFFHHQNVALLNMLRKSLGHTSRNISITVKPHPLCPIDHQDFPLLQFRIDTRPLAEQLSECDFVLATNGTSASAEAYQCGIPVATVLNGDTFNFSPLRNVPGAVFVESPAHLAEVLDHLERLNLEPRSDFFHIDKSLTRWKHLLSI